MELLITSSDSNSVSGENHEVDSFVPGDLLNSKYQSIVKVTQKTSSANSLYRMKQRIKTNGFYFGTSIEVVLKLTIFTAVILTIFN